MSNIYVSETFRERWMERVQLHTQSFQRNLGMDLFSIPEDVAPPSEEFSDRMGSLVEACFSSFHSGNRGMWNSITTTGFSLARELGVNPCHVAPYIYLAGGEQYPTVPSQVLGLNDYGLAAFVFERDFPVHIADSLWSQLSQGLKDRISPVIPDLRGEVFLSTGGPMLLTTLRADSLSVLDGGGANLFHPRMIEQLRAGIPAWFATEIMPASVYVPMVRLATTQEINDVFQNLTIGTWLRTNITEAEQYFRGLGILSAYEASIPREDRPRPAAMPVPASIPTTGATRPVRSFASRAHRNAMIHDEAELTEAQMAGLRTMTGTTGAIPFIPGAAPQPMTDPSLPRAW